MSEDLSITLIEDTYKEEWWQPELHCGFCSCTFMYTSYPKFPQYPRFCPNCGGKFTRVKRGDCTIYQLKKEK